MPHVCTWVPSGGSLLDWLACALVLSRIICLIVWLLIFILLYCSVCVSIYVIHSHLYSYCPFHYIHTFRHHCHVNTCQSNQSNQITMRVLSPMWEVALIKSILQAELLIYVATCLMSFNVTKRTVNQSYSSLSSWVFLAGAQHLSPYLI